MNTLTFIEFIDTIIDIFKQRNESFFNIGGLLVIISVVLLKHSGKIKLKACFFSTMLVGFFLLVLSFSHGSGWILFTNGISGNEFTDTNSVRVSIHDKEININNEQFDLTEFEEYILDNYVDGTEFIVCDEYAENSTYDSVIFFLNSNYYSVSEKMIKPKGE